MKYLVLLSLVLLLISCQEYKILSYEGGLEQCNQIQKEKAKANPDAFVFVGPECIVGARIPEFEGTTMDGKKINAELLKGKLSIINFWFITCAPCVAEIPGLNAIVEKYGEEKINYLAVGRDSNENVEAFLKEHPWKFDHIVDAEYLIKKDFKLRWGFPTTFVLNKKAEIIMAFSGGKTDETAVAEIQKKLIPVIEKELK